MAIINNSTALALTLLIAFSINRFLKFRADVKTTSHLPGFIAVFAPVSLFGALLPSSWYNPGIEWAWNYRSFVYKYFKSETISCVSLFGKPCIYTSSADVAKQILSGEQWKEFIKAPDTVIAVLHFGDSVVTTNGEVWKKHRKISGPCFSSKLYTHVWDEQKRLYEEIYSEEKWTESDTLAVERFDRYILKMTIIIISRCGLGLPFPWKSDKIKTDEIDPYNTILCVAENVILRYIIPSWMYKLPIPKLHIIDKAFKNFSVYVKNLLATKKEEILGSSNEDFGSDLLSRMAQLSTTDSEITEDELIGNLGVLIFAGYETTAKALNATLGFLALYPDEQEICFQQIQEVFPDGLSSSYEDFTKLDKLSSCYLEASRMYPASFVMMRDATTNIALKIQTEKGTKTIVVPKGLRVVIDTIGLQYNPHTFPEPEEFRPSRWYGVRETDASSFGCGPRSCIGRKFSLTEAVSFLTLFLRDWKIEPLLNPGESLSQWRTRVMNGKLSSISFGVGTMPLKMTRRK